METGSPCVRPVMVDNSDLRVTPEGSSDAASDSPEPPTGAQQDKPTRRRLDEVFGDVLPDSTRDERSDRPDEGRDDALLDDVPPHHG